MKALRDQEKGGGLKQATDREKFLWRLKAQIHQQLAGIEITTKEAENLLDFVKVEIIVRARLQEPKAEKGET